MATSISFQNKLCPKYPQLSNNSQPYPTRFLLLHCFPNSPRRFPATLTVCATSSAAVEPVTNISPKESILPDDNPFACPICYEPLIQKGPSGFNSPSAYRSGFQCQKCNRTYTGQDFYLDLTITGAMKEYKEISPIRTEVFRSPLVSFLYERGWRQAFNISGFPGPDEEFKMAQEYLKPAEGGLLVDVSCGSGLFSRKFIQSKTYAKVIALDYSENMLLQCYNFIKQDATISTENLALVRADVSRLPFASGTVDAIHAGAALHCWPSPSNAIAEIFRVLRSGGVFVGTTFLRYGAQTSWIERQFRERLLQNHHYFPEDEIKDLCTSCGFTDYSSNVRHNFIMFSGQKP